jgi:hypothetical protein
MLIAALVWKHDHKNHYCPSTTFFHVNRNTVAELEPQGINLVEPKLYHDAAPAPTAQ